MRKGPAWIVVIGSLLLLLGSFADVFRQRLSRDLYPQNSTLRADPKGLRLLHDTLVRVPGTAVSRYLDGWDKFKVSTPRTIIVAGTSDPTSVPSLSEQWRPLYSAAEQGSRLVILLTPAFAYSEQNEDTDESSEPESESEPETEDEPEVPEPEESTEPPIAPLVWGFTGRAIPASEHTFPTTELSRAEHAPANLPASLLLSAAGSIDLEDGHDWRVLYTMPDGGVAVAERPLGRGSLVVANQTEFLQNRYLQEHRPLSLLTFLVGPHRQVVFVEGHLGVTTNKGIAQLARRYGLAPAMVLGGVLALLYIWRRQALFLPPEPEAAHVALHYDPIGALAALLRRAVPPQQLPELCWEEWSRRARTVDQAKVKPALSQGRNAVDRYNSACRALRRPPPR